MVAKVCFMAVAEKPGQFGPFSHDSTMAFEKAVTNVGDYYDPASGIFTAPVAGSYFFSFFYQAPKSNKSGLSLCKNGSVIIKTFDDNNPGSYICDNGGNIAVLKLTAGDKVSVHLPANCCIQAANDVTTFSGFLLA